MANQKLTQEELDKLSELSQKNNALINELGNISLVEINLGNRKEAATKFLQELRDAEQELVKSLEETYGAGSIDIQKGEFIPNPEAQVSEEVVEGSVPDTTSEEVKDAK